MRSYVLMQDQKKLVFDWFGLIFGVNDQQIQIWMMKKLM